MHPIRRIEAIKSTLDGGEEGAAEIRAAARLLERSVPVGNILAAVADTKFPNALIVASQGCEESEERAWLTLGAAGARRACQVLAWRASQLLDPDELATLTLKRRGARAKCFERHAAAADSGIAAAWGLLAHLRGSELRAMVRARPALAAARRRADSTAPALRVALV